MLVRAGATRMLQGAPLLLLGLASHVWLLPGVVFQGQSFNTYSVVLACHA